MARRPRIVPDDEVVVRFKQVDDSQLVDTPIFCRSCNINDVGPSVIKPELMAIQLIFHVVWYDCPATT
jgi:hypothetical protein